MPIYIDWKALAPWAHLVWTIGISLYVWRATRKEAREKMIQDIRDTIAKRPTKEDLDEEKRRIAASIEAIEARCKVRKATIEELYDATRDLKNDIGHMPTHQDLNRMSDRMTTLGGQMEKLTGRLEGMNRAVDLMNEFLISQGSKT